MGERRGVSRRELLRAGSTGALAWYLAGCGGGAAGGGAGQGTTAAAKNPKGVDVGDVGKNPIVLGLALGISGSNSVFAPSVIQATRLAALEVNEAGGVLGRKIKVVLADDGTDPRVARQAWSALIRQQHVDGVISPTTSANRNAGVPVAQAAGTPAIYCSQYEGGACSPILYVNAEVPNQQITPEVNYLTQQKGAHKFFLVGSDYVFPRKSFAIAKPIIKKNGASVVGEEYAPIGTTDWSAIVAKMQQSQPDAIFAITVAGSDPVTLMKQLRSAGIDAPVASTVIEETGLKALGSDGKGILMAAGYFQVLNTPENKKFLAALKQRFGKVEPQNLYSTPCYDAVHEYAKAFKDAGTTKPSKVLEALAGVEVTGPRGRVTLNRDRHATMPIYLAEGQSDSTFKIVKSFGEVTPTRQCNPEPAIPS